MLNAERETAAQNLPAWQFGLRELMFYVSHLAVGAGAVFWLYDIGEVALMGSLLATVIVAAFVIPAKPAPVDLDILAFFWTLALIGVALQDWPRETRMGEPARLLWWSELVGLGLVPAVVGLFWKRLSRFGVYTIAFLLPVGTLALFTDDDRPTFALVLWTASVMCFVGMTGCRQAVRQRRWLLLPPAALCLAFGELLVYAFSWAIYFFE